MATSIFLAKYFGFYFLLMCVLYLLKPNQYKTMVTSFSESPAAITLGGVMTLMLGLFLVMIHTVIVADWRLLVTVLCWLVFIKGWCLLACPKYGMQLGKKMVGKKNRVYFMLAFYIILALVLLYFGYCDRSQRWM